MGEYIKREDALKIIDNYSKAATEEGKVVVDAIRDIIAVITPTADVVLKREVARDIFDAFDKAIGSCEAWDHLPAVLLQLLARLKTDFLDCK